MKKILFLQIFLVIFSSGYSQLKINGFGKIQLGLKIDEIPELANSVLIDNQDDFIRKVYRNTETNIVYELKSDTTEPYPTFGSLSNRVRIFQIGEYVVNENIKFQNIRLNFFEGKLYEIIVPGSEIDELLTTKYGKPKSTLKEVSHTFVNGLGNKFIKKDQTFTNTYTTNNTNVSCINLLMSWYDSKGERNFLQETTIKNILTSKQVQIDEENARKRIENRNELQKKKKITNF